MDFFKPFIDVLFWLLQGFHSVTGNWGVAIVLLTVLVRVILLPLTIKQTRSMRMMQELQPKMTELKEKYKDDRERQSKEMMKMWQEHKVNPFSGCLPILPQIPIMLSLFWMLTDKNINQGLLVGADFLWISDLSANHDIALVALMAITQVASMWMVTKDPQQRKIMIPMMAVLMPVIAWNLPAGVVLYWATMNIWVIGQQWIQFRTPLPVPAGAGGQNLTDNAPDKKKAVDVKASSSKRDDASSTAKQVNSGDSGSQGRGKKSRPKSAAKRKR